MPKYDLILFDLDGTLADTSEGIYNAHRYASQRIGYPLKEEDLEGVIGDSLLHVYKGKFNLPEDDARFAVSEYRRWYAQEGRLQAFLYPGVSDTLKYLKKKNYTLGVATLKLGRFAQEMLETFDVARFFDVICGVDENDHLTKSDIINLAIEKSGIPREKTVLIGDSRHDAEGARLSEIAFIGCLYGFGYNRQEEVQADGGIDSIESIIELKKII